MGEEADVWISCAVRSFGRLSLRKPYISFLLADLSDFLITHEASKGQNAFFGEFGNGEVGKTDERYERLNTHCDRYFSDFITSVHLAPS